MAIFGFKQKKYNKTEQGAEAAKSEKTAAKTTKAKKVTAPKIAQGLTTKNVAAPAHVPSSMDAHAAVILRPRVTEKSGILSQMNIYTFEVAPHANKDSISKAVKLLYKVSPVKIAITNLPAKHVFVRGRKGIVSGVKKALVTLKQGDKIDFV